MQRFRELEQRIRAAGRTDTSQLVRADAIAVAIEHMQQAIDALEFTDIHLADGLEHLLRSTDRARVSVTAKSRAIGRRRKCGFDALP